MINTYRLNPGEYLTVTACRRNLAGDVGAIMRVHAFLEQWGLINYQVGKLATPIHICSLKSVLNQQQVDPDTRPAALGPPFTGHFRVTLDTPRGLSNLLHAGTKPNTGALALQAQSQANGSSTTPHPSNLDIRKTIYHSTSRSTKPVTSEEATKLAESSATNGDAPAPKIFACETCGTDCTRTRYHSLKDGEYTICPSCFVSGRFPSTMYSGEFVRMDEETFKHASSGAGAEWSDQETLLLLEGVEMYDDDWKHVADHVGTRSKEQCIAKFLQLPIEDSYLTADPAAELGPLRYQAGMNGLPFEGSDNPVMSVVAFLASAVGPAVAAAAAQSALGELSEGLKRKRGNEVSGGKKQKTEDGESGENGVVDVKEESESMAVDSEEEKGEGDGQADAAAQDTTNSTSDPTAPTKSSVEGAAAIALGSAAAKASSLARHEDARLSVLVSNLVAAQVKKVELKLKMFERLEEMLENEKRNVERGRQVLFKEKIAVAKQLGKVEEMIKRAKEPSQVQNQSQNPGQGQSQGQTQASGQGQGGVSIAEVAEVREGLRGTTTASQVREVTGKEGIEIPQRGESQVQQL